MKAQVLRHKTEITSHGLLLSSCLYKTGANIPPQLFDEHWNKDDLAKIIKNSFASLDDFELMKVTWYYDK
jgi:hypothetical protein